MEEVDVSFERRAVRQEIEISNPPTEAELKALSEQWGKTPEEIVEIIKAELIKRINSCFLMDTKK